MLEHKTTERRIETQCLRKEEGHPRFGKKTRAQRAAWQGLSLDGPKRKEEQRMRCGSSMGAGQVRQPKPGSEPLSWVTRSGALSLRTQGTTFQMHFKQADVLGTKEH
ncbi:hypothetical protein SRHO_G00269180 [Serrasalmus rhombeus]